MADRSGQCVKQESSSREQAKDVTGVYPHSPKKGVMSCAKAGNK